MSNEELITKTAELMKQKFSDEGTGHDWWHMERVWKTAKYIGSKEKAADMLVVQLGALLHDIADWKFHKGSEDAGPEAARKWLESLGAVEQTILQVEDIVRNISFKGAKVKDSLNTLEAKIVYDADKLDAIGAIGIARCFAFGGSSSIPIYIPSQKPVMHESFEAYKKHSASSLNHFYEKLLLLKDRMYTKTGKQMAIHRHEYMEEFLKEFYAEWDGKI